MGDHDSEPRLSLQDLPCELLIETLAHLDYSSLVSISSMNKHFHHYAQDELVWRAVHQRTFSRSRTPIEYNGWQRDFAQRIQALKEFLVKGTNDYHAPSARILFTEMSTENGDLLYQLLECSDHTIPSLLVECQGYAMSNVYRLLPACQKSAVEVFLQEHKDRLQIEPRSEVFLLRLLLARQTGHRMGVSNVEIFLKCAHLVTYNTLHNPLFFFPPSQIVTAPGVAFDRYNLRPRDSGNDNSEVISGEGPIVNWGVIETIHSLVKLYRDRMGEAIPNFVKSRDDYETEVPMISEMFDAGLEGNWKGLYGYLDFRELEVLDSTRAFTPDFFDGIQNLKIEAEKPAESFLHPATHGFPEVQGSHDIRSATDGELWTEEIMMNQGHHRNRFIADGATMHGGFHIHGSTIQIPNFEPGFKIVSFDQMYNSDGRMPWIMSGVYIPSIGIVGSWRDRSEPHGEGVEGPYCLWRDRAKDLRDQEARMRKDEAERAKGNYVPPRATCKVRHLRRANNDMAYIIVEELSRLQAKLEERSES